MEIKKNILLSILVITNLYSVNLAFEYEFSLVSKELTKNEINNEETILSNNYLFLNKIKDDIYILNQKTNINDKINDLKKIKEIANKENSTSLHYIFLKKSISLVGFNKDYEFYKDSIEDLISNNICYGYLIKGAILEDKYGKYKEALKIYKDVENKYGKNPNKIKLLEYKMIKNRKARLEYKLKKN